MDIEMSNQSLLSALEYLVVDEFLQGFIESAALDVALKCGLIDELTPPGASVPADRYDWTRSTFLALLRSNNVVEMSDGRVMLTQHFRKALSRRDLLEAKLHFTMILAGDLAGQPGDVFHMGRFGTFEPRYLKFFSYDETTSNDPDERAATLEWVSYMTVLTRHESAVGLALYDFSCHQRMMDIGGNTGEFIHQVLEATADLKGIVFDLPGVVAIGKHWNVDRPTADRVEYVAGNAFEDPLPAGCDLISFKGVLHDWPDAEARTLVARAWDALEPGGKLLIFERSATDLSEHLPIGFNQYTMLAWVWIFKGPARYLTQLEELGAVDIQLQEFDLDLPWLLITAIKPA